MDTYPRYCSFFIVVTLQFSQLTDFCDKYKSYLWLYYITNYIDIQQVNLINLNHDVG